MIFFFLEKTVCYQFTTKILLIIIEQRYINLIVFYSIKLIRRSSFIIVLLLFITSYHYKHLELMTIVLLYLNFYISLTYILILYYINYFYHNK